MNAVKYAEILEAFDNEGIAEFDSVSSINPQLTSISDIHAANDEAEYGMHEIDLTVPQMEFYELEEKYPLFVAGFGSGKSITMAIGVIRDLINYPGANIGVYAPTFDLLKLIVIAYIAEMLDEGGYEFKYNGQEHTFYVHGYGKIICRSLDNPARIVGYETFRAHCDEFDILTEEKADLAWKKIIARNRQKIYQYDDNERKVANIKDGVHLRDEVGVLRYLMELNRVSAYTTPEGWKFAYRRWVELEDKLGHYARVHASTYSNEHNLPDDYIDSMKNTYPPELIDAYINGEFTNLTSGRVYRNFDRELNGSKEIVQGNEMIFIGMDFNIEHGAALIHVERTSKEDKQVEDHAVDEIADSYDTDETISIIKERYPDNPVCVYPDASGSKRSSGGSNGVSSKGEATSTDLYKLKAAGFQVIVNYSNPAIKDRVGAYSARICNANGERRYFVNTAKCPNATKTLEQQVWTDNGVPDKSSGLDHMGDSGGYYICKKHPIIKTVSGYAQVNNRR